jgi:hypothetical protein
MEHSDIIFSTRSAASRILIVELSKRGKRGGEGKDIAM